jgi:hypothetical protein
MRGPASIHGKNAIVLALALLGSIPYGIAAVGSVALGGGIQVLNLLALDRTLWSLRGLAGSGSGTGLRALLGLRFVLVVGLAGWVIIALPVEPAPFAFGLGTLIPAALWHGLDSARRERLRGT